MSHPKRLKALLCMALMLVAQPLLAQNYPNKTIRFIVGFTTGGPNDIIARIVGQKLSDSMGVPVTVDNRPGADSIIGTQLTARAAPDGHTISMISASATIHPSVYSNIPYDIAKDFSPITVVASGSFILVVNPSLPVKSVRELIELAKARPGQLNFSSSGLGGSVHLMSELFKSLAQISMNHIPYKGGAPAVTDVVSGQVDLIVGPMAVVMPHIRSGKLRALAVTGGKRWPALPDLPTMAEAGVPRYEATGWYGIVAPARMPRAVVTRLNQEIVKGLGSADVRQQLASFDLEPIGNSPEEMAAHINAELVKWANVARDAKIVRGSLE